MSEKLGSAKIEERRRNTMAAATTAPKAPRQVITGRVTRTNDNGVMVEGEWFNFSKQRQYPGNIADLQSHQVTITWTPWSTSDGAKSYKYIDALEFVGSGPQDPSAGQQAELAPAPSPRAPLDYDPGLSARDYMNARMSALKTAVRLGAQNGQSSEACIAVAEVNLRWILNQAE